MCHFATFPVHSGLRHGRLLSVAIALAALVSGCGGSAGSPTAARAPATSVLRGHRDIVLGVGFSPDGRTLASGGEDATVRLWDVRTGKPLGKTLRGSESVHTVAFSTDARTLVSASPIDETMLWDVRNHERLGRPLGTGVVAVVALDPAGRRLATASVDVDPSAKTSGKLTLWSVQLWDLHTRERLGRPVTIDTQVVDFPWSIALGPDRRTIAVGSANGLVRLVDGLGHKQLGRPIRGHTDSVESVAFSPDGRTLASTSTDGTVRLWNVSSQRQLGQALHAPGDYVQSVAFSHDGRKLATGDASGAVRLWSVQTHKRLGRPLRGHSDIVESVAFSPDGKLLASASDDETVRLWNLASFLR